MLLVRHSSSCDIVLMICVINSVFGYRAGWGRQLVESLNLNNKRQDTARSAMAASTSILYAFDFEVFGKVQGVFFRKHTEQQAKRLGLRGWCMNTADGTVKGKLEGPQTGLAEMKQWLEQVGSPKSRIQKAHFTEMKPINEYTFKAFVIKR